MGIIMYKGVAYGGGSDVTANPQDTATADLEKVKIDGTTYDVTDANAIHSADVGVANGVAELDANGFVPQAQLPSYVDDVLEYASVSAFPATGESGKIYVALDTNKTYRWSGSGYVEISESLALGETSSTAYRGDRGKTAYDHSQTTSGNPHNVTKTDVGLGNVPNVATDDQTPTVTEASTRANLAVGDSLKTIIGKIKKFFSDLKTVAFTGSYNDLTDKPTIPTNTDEKVKQENTTGSADYRVLLSNGANDTTETKTARKSTNLKFNPSTGNLQATQLNGVNIGSSPKFTDTDTKVTSSANHYTPSTASGQDKTASASGATAAWSIDVVKGVTLNTDGKGHVTGLSVTSGKIPSNPNTDTKVTQTEASSSSYDSNNYELLMSGTADETTRTEGAKKSGLIKCNPYLGVISANTMQFNATTEYAAKLSWADLASKQFLLPNDNYASGQVSLMLATREWANTNLVSSDSKRLFTKSTAGNNAEGNAVRITMTYAGYAYFTGIMFTRYGVAALTFGFGNGYSTAFVSISRLFGGTANETFTGTVYSTSSTQAIFQIKSTATWNHFSIFGMTSGSSDLITAFTQVKV